MKIAVISDTHVGTLIGEAPEAMWRLVESADAVAHLGDFTDEDFATRLEAQSRAFAAVAGNGDGLLHGRFSRFRYAEFGPLKVAMLHELSGSPTSLAAQVGRYRGEGARIVLCGHTHRPLDMEIDGVRILNPGSVADGRRSGCGRTAGLLTVGRTGRVAWRIVSMDADAGKTIE